MDNLTNMSLDQVGLIEDRHPTTWKTSEQADHYRFHGGWYWMNDGAKPLIHLTEYRTVRTTPKGRWLIDIHEVLWAIEAGYAKEHFVLDDARRRYAYPTLELAWDSFMIRQRKRLQHVKNQYDGVASILSKIAEYEE